MSTSSVNDRVRKLLSNRRVWAGLLIAAGLAVILFFGARAVRSYHELQYIREQGLDQGTASVQAIRGWMTVKYVSVAYAVPLEYMFDRLDIPFDRRNANAPLGHLNREYQLGRSESGGYPLIVDHVAAAILDYRENPVAPGLNDIRPWMTLQYIANSTGIPADTLLERLSIPNEGNNLYLPLPDLAEAVRYEGGPKGLENNIMAVIDSYEGE